MSKIFSLRIDMMQNNCEEYRTVHLTINPKVSENLHLCVIVRARLEFNVLNECPKQEMVFIQA